jgi:hypothetical protein
MRHPLDGTIYDPQGPETSEYRRGCEDCGEVRCEGGAACPANQPAEGELVCACGYPLEVWDGDLVHVTEGGAYIYQEHAPEVYDAEAAAEAKHFADREDANEIRGFNDYDPPENDPYDEEW